jgi:hypothetical protein
MNKLRIRQRNSDESEHIEDSYKNNFTINTLNFIVQRKNLPSMAAPNTMITAGVFPK